jgi:predicted TPR repeat methyltransferase
LLAAVRENAGSMSDPFVLARQHFLDGVAQFEAHRLEDAARSFEAALALAPGRPSVLTNLGATRVRLGQWAQAVPLLEQATAAEPDNLDAWGHLGTALAELGRATLALAAFDRALALNPKLVEAWSRRGSLLRELGRLPEAASCFERALALGAEPTLHAYYLAAVRNEGVPPAPPREYVERLFDGYAGEFSGHLVAKLRYQAHAVLVRGLDPHAPPRWGAVLDLGCGTGLCGPLVKPVADRVDGVDLSAAMLVQARALGVYDGLAHADVAEHLGSTAKRYDLVLAADVFIYVGSLDAVFAGVSRVLNPQGVFAFSVEVADGDADLHLMPSLRYAHSEAYVRRLAREHGLAVRSIGRAPLRDDQRRPVQGLYVYLARA